MSFFEYMMRRAAPVLFWASVLLFIGGVAASLLLQGQVSPYGGEGPIIDARAFVNAIVQGLSAAVWPFMGAGLIWTLGKRGGGNQ